MTVQRVKEKLQTHVGSSVSAMRLQLRDESGRVVASLDDDARLLGYFSPRDGYTLHVLDTDASSASASGWLEDTSKVEKYVLSDEAYAARDNTYRKFKEEQRRRDPSWTAERELAQRRGEAVPAAAGPPAEETHEAAEAAGVALGARCEVQPGGKRGCVAYVGNMTAPGLPLGWWVGVRFDEPVGKHDGCVGGVRFFECPAGYGVLLRPSKVTTGDFPELDPFEDDDEM